MQDERIGSPAGTDATQQIPVSPNNPCPFLRALVAGSYVSGHIVPLPTLTRTIEAATGERGLKKRLAGLEISLVALIANGLGPLRLLRSWWSGAQIDALRDGPLDKHGVGSRILDAKAQVDDAEIVRLAGFGNDRVSPAGEIERGLTSEEITTFMNANFERAKGSRRPIDRRLMNGEWPVLLNVMGKGEGEERYLSVAEVSALFAERRLPDRIVARLAALPAPAPRSLIRMAGKFALWTIALAALLFVAIVEFPDRAGSILPQFISQILPPPLPTVPPVNEAHWLDQNWSTEDRHWFHHASQGTATFPVPYDWFIALEQPGLRLFSRPGLLRDSGYLERFGFIPSPKSVNTDEASLRPFGYSPSPDAKTEPAPASVAGLEPTPAENFDGLPVGFARLTGAIDPGTGEREADQIGLSCAACHAGSIRYKGVSLRFDGGPAMVNLKKLEIATGLSIAYTLKVPGRFQRFAARVLGADASKQDRDKFEQRLATVGQFLLDQKNLYDKTIAGKKTYDGKQQQADTEEGFGRLDALNRIGNQVFYTDLVTAGLSGFEKNLHAQDAPVSFPPIWTVPWFLWAQYDASIEQPLIRNAGEALGVSALVNFSPDTAPETVFRSTVAIENLVRIEAMLRGPDPAGDNPAFGGLQPPKWPSQIFQSDPAWKINEARVEKGRALYAEICVECHLGPVNDPTFDKLYPRQSFWSSERWDAKNKWLDPVQKGVAGMGTDKGQADVLFMRKVEVPGFLNLQPRQVLSQCPDMPPFSTEMPYPIALMMVVDVVSRKWMKERPMTEENQKLLWGTRKNCPNDETEHHQKKPQDNASAPVKDEKPRYRARPLNGVWATAPYLHNGSVPSLYWMLKPAAERPKQFCMGLRDFDPEQVGYRVAAGEKPACQPGETLFSAMTADGLPIPGNSTLGHSLEGTPGPGKAGVIGRMLTEEERYDLIEYLKTL